MELARQLAETLEKAQDPCEWNRPCGADIKNESMVIRSRRVEEVVGDPTEFLVLVRPDSQMGCNLRFWD
jgi:hypothetical protein